MMSEKQTLLTERASAAGQKTMPDVQIMATPEASGEARLVDYIVGVLPNGRPTQHAAWAGCPDSVQSVQKDADEKAAQIRQQSSGGVQLLSSDWIHMLDDTATFEKCPYGEIKHNFRWRKRSEEDDDDGEDVFAFKQICSMTPGKNKYSDCDDDWWHNEWMKAVNNYDQSEFNNVSLFQSSPDDDSGRTIDVGIEYKNASWSWSFDTNGSVYKSIDGQRPIWEVHEIKGAPLSQTQELEPGSVMIMDDDIDGERKLTNLRFEGHFENGMSLEDHYLYHNWNVYLDNSIQD